MPRREKQLTPEQRQRKAERQREYRSSPEYQKRMQTYNREQRPRDREQRRNHWVKSAYGITVQQENEMWAAQGGRCAICGRRRKLVVDHCHDSGVVRGLLCRECNTGLGHLGDTPAGLRRALRYLLDAQKRLQSSLPLSDTPDNESGE